MDKPIKEPSLLMTWVLHLPSCMHPIEATSPASTSVLDPSTLSSTLLSPFALTEASYRAAISSGVSLILVADIFQFSHFPIPQFRDRVAGDAPSDVIVKRHYHAYQC